MIAGELLGLPMDDIAIVHGDTDRVPAGLGSYASRSVQLAGSAIHQACDAVSRPARQIAADRLEVAPDDIVFDQRRGCFHVIGTPSRPIDWRAIAAAAEGRRSASRRCSRGR